MTTTSTTSAWARLFSAVRRRPVVSAAIALAVLVCVSVVGVYVAMQTEAGRSWLARYIESALSQTGRREVTIGRIEGHLPGEVRIDALTVADGEGGWLTIRRLAFDWNPLALFRGRIEIESAAAGEIVIARRPVADTTGPETALPGMPPLEIAVHHVAVDALRLDEPLLGAAATLRAAAEMNIGAEAVHATLDIARTDGIAGRANAVLGYEPATRSLDLRAELSEPRGGLIARLLALPQLPAIGLSLTGEGPAADWRGTAKLDAEDLASLDSQVTISIDAAQTRVAFQGTARPGPASGAAELLFGPQTEFNFTLTRPASSDRLVVAVERLQSAAIGASATGELALGERNVEAEFRLTTRDAARVAPFIAPVRLAQATVEGRLSGPLTHPAIDLDAKIGETSTGTWSARQLDMHARLRPDGPVGRATPVRVEGQAALAGFRSPVPELNAAFGDNVKVAVANGVLQGRAQLTIGNATVAGAHARGTVAGSVALATGGISARGGVELDDLSPFSDRAGRAIRGRLRTAYDVSYEPAGTLSIGLDGIVHDGGLDLAVAEALLGARTAIAGRVDRLVDGHWQVTDVAVHGAGASASGRISIPPDVASISAEYDMKVTDLAALGLADPARPGGSLVIRGTAAGPARNPAIEGIATLMGAAAAGFAVDRLVARYMLPRVDDGWKGRVELNAENALLPDLSGGFEFALEERAIKLTSLRMTARGTAVSGNLAVPLDGPPLTGALTVEAADLSRWSPIAQRRLAGRLKAAATLSVDDGRQQVSLAGTVRSLSVDETFLSQDLSATAKMSDALGEQRFAITVTSRAGRAGPIELHSLAADVSGTLSSAEVTLRASGDLRGPLRLEADGSLRRNGERTILTVARLNGEALGAPVALRQPAVLETGPEAKTADAELTLGDGTVRASLRRTPKTITLEAAARTIPLTLFWPDAPPQAETTRVDANAALSGPADRPDGRFDLSLTGLAPGELEAAPKGLALNVSARLRNGVLAANGLFAGLEEAAAEFEAKLPVRLSLAPVAVQFDDTAPASGTLAYRGPMEPFRALAQLDRHRLQGNADVRLRLEGSLRDPRVEGRAELTAGRYENLETGTVLSDIRLRAHPADGSIIIDEATAGDGNGGQVSVTGNIGFGGRKGFTVALDATFDRARLVRRDELTAVSSGTVSLRGDRAGRTIAGRLDIEDAEIRLIAGTSPDVVQIEVEETGTPPAGVPPPPPVTKPSNTHLDLALSMPKRVFVRGRGLESEWGGELLVTGTTASPRLQGTLRPLRGRYDFLGKVFALRDGSIDFAGAEQIDPSLDLSAERAVGDMTAIIRVTGTARQPIIRMASIPEVPQDEVLSQVLFNKSTGRLTAMEAVQLGQAAATMTGATGGGGIVDFGRRMLSLDVLEFKSAEEAPDGAGTGQTSVEAGKYVTDDVYIGVEGGATGATGATVEIEVTPRIKIEGDVGQKEKEKIGIKWKRDY